MSSAGLIDVKRIYQMKPLLLRFSGIIYHNFCTDAKSESGIFIPDKIDRGPTDILKALSKSMQRDETAYHYKFPDDPYFYTTSSIAKRVQALCLESGRKSARWIVQNNPEFFREKIAQPPIKLFSTEAEYNESSIISEDTLVGVINDRNVEDAIIIHGLLEEKGIDVSLKCKQKLLELVCFYNCENMPLENEPESRWHQKSQEKTAAKRWKDKQFAERLFESIQSESQLAYSAIIQGMLIHGQTNEGMRLFNFANENNISLSVGVYNEIILNVATIRESNRWTYVLDILKEMKMKKIKPNLGTLNAILDSLLLMDNLNNKMNLALKTVEEFKKLDIEGSLGTHYYLIRIMCSGVRERKSKISEYSFIRKILETLNKSDHLDIRHPSDILFFPVVMKTMADLKSPDLSHMLNDILDKSDHKKFITGSMDENMYYSNYLYLSFKFEPIEDAMTLFEKFVPTSFIPDIRLHKLILAAIDNYETYEYVPTVWNVVENQGRFVLNSLLAEFLRIAPKYKGDNQSVIKVFCDAASHVLNAIREKQENSLELNGDIISNVLLVLTKSDDFKKALDLFTRVNENIGAITLTPEAITAFYDRCVAQNHKPYLLDCLRLAQDINHPSISVMAEKALALLTHVKEADRKWIAELMKSSQTSSTSEISHQESK